MTYAIVGFGPVGQALAHAFARSGIEVAVAASRPPEALVAQVEAIGPSITPKTLADAVKADVVILAVPFANVRDVAAAAASWEGKIVIDATNAFGTPLAEFNGLTASAVNAKAFPGSRFVKGFNHLPAKALAADPDIKGGRRVIFFASDDKAALAPAAALAEQLGYAPVSLGTLAEGGPMTQGRGDSWSPLTFQDLVKFY
jgi:predicted dinucleotide-binding enzyme